MTARALVLQTQENCPPGLLDDWAASRGAELEVVRVDEQLALPPAGEYQFAIALGSEASLAAPLSGWMARELDWLRQAAHVGVPVLGICFGAQALAVALGGRVERLPAPELGWIDVETVDDQRVPVGPWLAWHEDHITPPPLAGELARNATGTQAFASGPHLGVQFHPEATPALIERWARGYPRPVPDDVRSPTRERQLAAATAAARLFDGFWNGRARDAVQTAAIAPVGSGGPSSSS
jgi:GMP synthase-like glutamine amidotransferase